MHEMMKAGLLVSSGTPNRGKSSFSDLVADHFTLEGRMQDVEYMKNDDFELAHSS